MLMVKVGYPTREQERTVMDRMTSKLPTKANVTTTPEQLSEARKVVRDVYVDDRVKETRSGTTNRLVSLETEFVTPDGEVAARQREVLVERGRS